MTGPTVVRAAVAGTGRHWQGGAGRLPVSGGSSSCGRAMRKALSAEDDESIRQSIAVDEVSVSNQTSAAAAGWLDIQVCSEQIQPALLPPDSTELVSAIMIGLRAA